MFWTVSSFPPCTHHIFLSHCREDHERLVVPVREGLRERNIVSWLDREDYFYGRDSRAALRDGILRSRHTVFFITEAMLASSRGWCVLELAFAELLQSGLVRPGGALANIILPLFFIPQDDLTLPRTVWQLLRDRGRFHGATDGERGAWAQNEIARFIRDEQRLAADHAAAMRTDHKSRKELERLSGLLSRVTKFDPQPVPEHGAS